MRKLAAGTRDFKSSALLRQNSERRLGATNANLEKEIWRDIINFALARDLWLHGRTGLCVGSASLASECEKIHHAPVAACRLVSDEMISSLSMSKARAAIA
jgi:hypothetical protein